MNPPLLSIVIPTKNRQYYCLESIKHIISLKLQNIEIVVQDNSDTNELEKTLESSGLINRITYHYQPKLLSFVRNFSEALELTSGEYIAMIGDDDSVLPNIISVALKAKENNYDAVIPELNFYFWPSDNPIEEKYRNGFLSTIPFKEDKYEKLDIDKALNILVNRHFQGYQELHIPRVYHGIVSRRALDKVKNTAGDYFKGLTPDMFMSIALCFTAPNSYTYKKPFTISGICPRSGSSDSATGKHTGKLSDAPHFRGHSNYEWSKEVPAIYTVETIWADTAIHALKIFDGGYYLNAYNPKKFAAELSYKYPQFSSELNDWLGSSLVAVKTRRTINKFFSLIDKSMRFATGKIAKKYLNVKNVSDACEILMKEYGLSK